MKLYQAIKTFYWSDLEPFDKDDSLTKVTKGDQLGNLDDSKGVWFKNRVIPVALPNSLLSNFTFVGTYADPISPEGGGSGGGGGNVNLRDGAGTPITSDTVGAKQALDVVELSHPENYRKSDTFTWATLTGSYVAKASVNIGATGNCYSQLVLLVSYTYAAATDLRVMVEFSPDSSNWYQEGAEVQSGANPIIGTYGAVEHVLPAATGKYRIAMPLCDGYYRVSAKETGTAGGAVTIIGIAGRA